LLLNWFVRRDFAPRHEHAERLPVEAARD